MRHGSRVPYFFISHLIINIIYLYVISTVTELSRGTLYFVLKIFYNKNISRLTSKILLRTIDIGKIAYIVHCHNLKRGIYCAFHIFCNSMKQRTKKIVLKGNGILVAANGNRLQIVFILNLVLNKNMDHRLKMIAMVVLIGSKFYYLNLSFVQQITKQSVGILSNGEYSTILKESSAIYHQALLLCMPISFQVTQNIYAS